MVGLAKILTVLLISYEWLPIPSFLERIPPVRAVMKEAIRAVAVENDLAERHDDIGDTVREMIVKLRTAVKDCKGAPSRAAWELLPEEEILKRNWEFALAHRDHIELKLALCTVDLRWWYAAWLEEADALTKVWQKLYYLKKYHARARLSQRRHAMAVAIEENPALLTVWDFEIGRYPPVVPLWRFTYID